MKRRAVVRSESWEQTKSLSPGSGSHGRSPWTSRTTPGWASVTPVVPHWPSAGPSGVKAVLSGMIEIAAVRAAGGGVAATSSTTKIRGRRPGPGRTHGGIPVVAHRGAVIKRGTKRGAPLHCGRVASRGIATPTQQTVSRVSCPGVKRISGGKPRPREKERRRGSTGRLASKLAWESQFR